MAITAARLIEHAEHRIGTSSVSGPFAMIDLVNQAGEWLFTAHPWRFLARPPTHLTLRGPIPVNAASWTEATRTISVPGPTDPFAGYTLLPGDQFQIISGSVLEPGYSDILSVTPNTVTLRDDMGADDPAIVGAITPGAIILPPDIQAFEGTPCGVLGGRWLIPVTPQGLIDARAHGVSAGGGVYYCSIFWGPSIVSQNGPPTPRLTLYPDPGADEFGVITLYYRSGWSTLVDDEDATNCPQWFDPLLIQAVRAYSEGIQKDNMEQTLLAVQASVMFDAAKRRDGAFQRRSGPIRGSKVRHRFGPIGEFSVPISYNLPT